MSSQISIAMKLSGKSREQIARIMSTLTGEEITVRRLNSYAADSRDDFRFPLEYLPAFCAATGCSAVLRDVARRCGFALADEKAQTEQRLGRAALARARAEAQIAKHLNGGAL